MSTVVIVNNANAGFPQCQGGPPAPIDNEHPKKDSTNTRVGFGTLGAGALAGGIAAQVASWQADDKYTGTGEYCKIFDEKPLSILNPKSWGRAIKANPKAFLLYAGLEVGSWISIFLGAALLQRAFTGRKAEKKKDKS